MADHRGRAGPDRDGLTGAASPAAQVARSGRRCSIIGVDLDLPLTRSENLARKREVDLAGLHSVRVNKQWRLVFQWDGSRGEAIGIYLDDHSYR